MMLTALTGALAGLFHVLSGPDHLAAVGPLALEERRHGWFVGWTWGLGHAAGVVVVAILAVLLRDMLPPIEVISDWSERVVGVALIGLGFWALRRSARIEPEPHAHGTLAHEHLHVRRGPAWFKRLGHAHASFCIGVLHGVAGSSHFFGVIPALALPSLAASFAYIAAFGVGSVVAMTAFAAAAGAAGSGARRAPAHRALLATVAVVSMTVGTVWLL